MPGSRERLLLKWARGVTDYYDAVYRTAGRTSLERPGRSGGELC
jgi:hypothetical protein